MTEYADVRIRWLTSAESGHATPVRTRREGSFSYRPHFRIGPEGEYLGVVFVDGDPPIVAPGDEGNATVELVYVSTGVDYSPLMPDVSFNVVEGPHIVGRGVVLRRYSTDDLRS